jgi:hypothetical protein
MAIVRGGALRFEDSRREVLVRPLHRWVQILTCKAISSGRWCARTQKSESACSGVCSQHNQE